VVAYLVNHHEFWVRRACACINLSRSAWYRLLTNWQQRDRLLIDALVQLSECKTSLGFWKLYRLLRRQGHDWKHNRVYRLYCALKLNIRCRPKKRIPTRDPRPRLVPAAPNQVWSADVMSDLLYRGPRFRTFNVLDHFNREVLAIEIDSSLTSERLIRAFEQLKDQRGLPDMLRTDNEPEFLGTVFTEWCKTPGIFIDYIESGKPKQNTYIERFNRTYRNKVLNIWLFRNLDEVREKTWQWMVEYKKERDHDSLAVLTPADALQQSRMSTFELPT